MAEAEEVAHSWLITSCGRRRGREVDYTFNPAIEIDVNVAAVAARELAHGLGDRRAGLSTVFGTASLMRRLAPSQDSNRWNIHLLPAIQLCRWRAPHRSRREVSGEKSTPSSTWKQYLLRLPAVPDHTVPPSRSRLKTPERWCRIGLVGEATSPRKPVRWPTASPTERDRRLLVRRASAKASRPATRGRRAFTGRYRAPCVVARPFLSHLRRMAPGGFHDPRCIISAIVIVTEKEGNRRRA